MSLSKQSTTLSVPLHSILSIAVTVKLREHENKNKGVETRTADVQQGRGRERRCAEGASGLRRSVCGGPHPVVLQMGFWVTW